MRKKKTSGEKTLISTFPFGRDSLTASSRDQIVRGILLPQRTLSTAFPDLTKTPYLAPRFAPLRRRLTWSVQPRRVGEAPAVEAAQAAVVPRVLDHAGHALVEAAAPRAVVRGRASAVRRVVGRVRRRRQARRRRQPFVPRRRARHERQRVPGTRGHEGGVGCQPRALHLASAATAVAGDGGRGARGQRRCHRAGVDPDLGGGVPLVGRRRPRRPPLRRHLLAARRAALVLRSLAADADDGRAVGHGAEAQRHARGHRHTAGGAAPLVGVQRHGRGSADAAGGTVPRLRVHCHYVGFRCRLEGARALLLGIKCHGAGVALLGEGSHCWDAVPRRPRKNPSRWVQPRASPSHNAEGGSGGCGAATAGGRRGRGRRWAA